MKNTREVKMSVLTNWLEKEAEINKDYNALEKALEELEELDNIYNEDDVADTLSEEYKEELRQQIITMNLYNDLYGFSSEEIVSEELEMLDNGVQTYASVNDTTEYKKGNKIIRIINSYEKSLTNEEVEKFETMTEQEKIKYVIEHGEYML